MKRSLKCQKAYFAQLAGGTACLLLCVGLFGCASDPSHYVNERSISSRSKTAHQGGQSRR
jgi:hypothetical protein